MKAATDFFLVLVTVPNLATARKLARAALDARLVACANVVPAIESHYVWKGKVEKSKEALMIIKTARERLPALESLILRLHPYDTPEIVGFPLAAGTPRYLAWLAESVHA
ncbi:divalent-cation tolerance protein CutA [bacterium]|nr:divalent-cation tolerance protein CutA [bacterium]